MTSAIERLKAMAKATTAPSSSLERGIMAETGLPVVFVSVPDPQRRALEQQLQPMVDAVDLPGIAASFDRLFAARAFSDSGYRTYRIAQQSLLAHVEIGCANPALSNIERRLARYQQWWQQRRTDPSASATYVRALLAAANARGDNPYDPANDDAATAFRDACGEARRVLAYAGPLGRSHWLWRQADFTLTFDAWRCGMEDEDLLATSFAAVQALDPHEFGIYDDRVGHLLPCWAGSIEAVDKFARASAKRTATRFGDLLYARIYDHVLGFEDPDETDVDPERLLLAFADWYERFPGQPLANRYAAHAHAFGDYAVLRALFRNVLREIHPEHWLDREQPLEAWRAVSNGRSNPS